jgi:multicomponent Na+:H+ antiporter subunit C
VATLLALVIGGLYAAGLYLMMRRNLVKLIIGLVLLSNGANLLIFTMAGLTRAHPPLIPRGASRLLDPSADPLPQALILTAIVIGFGVIAFLLVLVHRTAQAVGTDDLDAVRTTDV